MDTMALKVKACPSIAKVISIIRKYSSSSMGEIKSAVEHDQFIFEVDYLSIRIHNPIILLSHQKSKRNHIYLRRSRARRSCGVPFVCRWL